MAEDQLTMSVSDDGAAATKQVGRMPGYTQPNMIFFLTFLAFVVFRYIDGGHRMDILETIRFEFLLGGSAIAMSIIKISGKPIVVGEARKIVVLIGLLFLVMIVQLPMAGDPAEAQRVFIDRVFKFAMLTFLVAAMVESPKTLRLFLAAFLFATFYVTLEATQGQITGGLVWQNQGIMRLHGAVPMYGHPNSLAGVAMGALPFVVFLFVPVKKWIFRMSLLMAASTSMVCVIFTGSRTGYIGLLSLILWQFFQSPNKIKFLIVFAIVGSVAVSFLPEEYIGRFKSIGGHEAEGNSKEARMIIIEDALAILKDNPLGIGVASFPAVRTARFGRSQDTHNLYLEVATNLGIQGLAVFLALVGMMMASFRHSAFAFRSQRWRLIRAARTDGFPRAAMKHVRKHDGDLTFCYSAAQATAGFIIIRMVLGLFGMDLYEIYWWFASGVALALGGLVISTNRKTRFFEQLVTDTNQGPLA